MSPTDILPITLVLTDSLLHHYDANVVFDDGLYLSNFTLVCDDVLSLTNVTLVCDDGQYLTNVTLAQDDGLSHTNVTLARDDGSSLTGTDDKGCRLHTPTIHTFSESCSCVYGAELRLYSVRY